MRMVVVSMIMPALVTLPIWKLVAEEREGEDASDARMHIATPTKQRGVTATNEMMS